MQTKDSESKSRIIETPNGNIDSNKSLVWEQAKNRIYVQQSILYYLLKDVKK